MPAQSRRAGSVPNRGSIHLSPLAGRGRLGEAERVSDCVVGQAFCHGLLSRMMALRMVRSFRAVAMRATILDFPAATRRSRKALRVWVVTGGGHGGEEEDGAHGGAASADEAPAAPPPRLPGEGGKAGERRDLAPLEAAELGQLGL